MPPTASQISKIFDKDGYTQGEAWDTAVDGNGIEQDWWYGDHKWGQHNDFYSQVIHKTNGGQLPFIFQPDKDNYNPDQFAICRLDMKSFQYEQVANNVYNVKLKIRECW
jgi:hypothetical protein